MKLFKQVISIITTTIAGFILMVVFVFPIFGYNLIPSDYLKKITFLPVLSPVSKPIITPAPISSSSANIYPLTSLIPSSSPQIIPKTITQNIKQDDTQPWGVAQQVGEHTWTMKIGEDPIMATPSEILDALNNYRVNHGSQKLTWDQKLADYAQSRAIFFISNKNLDSHQGFNNFLENEDGFNKLGFTMLGENASFGYQLNGVHLIEWVYAGDEPHNKNQLDNRWNYVGIGVASHSTCLIFGTGKM
ncbi:MAG: CAP domain-containing protein [Candidatus Shapirobacteria bacterium]